MRAKNCIVCFCRANKCLIIDGNGGGDGRGVPKVQIFTFNLCSETF